MKGYKHTELGWIPEDWEVSNFGDVCSKLLDGTHFSPKSKTGPFKYLTSKNIRNEGLDLTEVNFISETEHKEIYKRCPVKYGDILLTKDGASTGACCLNTLKEEFSLLSSVAVLKSDERNLNNLFLYQFIKSSLGQGIILNAISGQAITRITLEKIRRFSICIPRLSEQSAIANILTEWDTAIRTLAQLISAKQQLKKGLMQQLLTGKKRFREFKNNKWEYSQLGNLASIRRGASPRPISDQRFFSDHGRGWIRISDVTSEKGQLLNSASQYLSDLGASQSVKVEVGDLIMSICATIGVPKIVNIPSCIHDGFVLIRDFKKNLDINYLYYFIDFMSSKLADSGQPGTQRNLNTDIVAKIPVPFISILEQKKIASVLSECDKDIIFFQKQLDFYKEQKKGLMQQLLTGKKRVRV